GGYLLETGFHDSPLRPLGLARRERDCLQNAASLGLRLAVLELGLCVGNRPPAGLYVRHPVLDHHRADVDARVEIAGIAGVADRGAVAAALDRVAAVCD